MTMAANADVQARIDQLFVYPIKSCAGIALPEVTLTDNGLLLDRSWMVVDEAGDFVTQRELPRMVLIQPVLKEGVCVVSAPGMLPLHLPLDAQGPSISVTVWSDTLNAMDMGEETARWFSEFLGPQAPDHLKSLRLVRFDPAVRRLCSTKWTGGREATTQFADGFGLLVASTASLAELNARLAQEGHEAVDITRFRPNIVLKDIEAHDEDRLGTLHIDTGGEAVVLESVKPCARCPIPNIDPATASTSPKVGDVLQTYRQDRRLAGAVTFGMNAIVVQGTGQRLAVGQRVGADWRFD